MAESPNREDWSSEVKRRWVEATKNTPDILRRIATSTTRFGEQYHQERLFHGKHQPAAEISGDDRQGTLFKDTGKPRPSRSDERER